MTRRLAALLAAMAFSTNVVAASAPVGQISIHLSSNNGSLPPPYHRATEIDIEAGGHGRFEKRFGYDRQDAKQRFEQRFELDAAGYAALIALVTELKVFDTEWREVERPNVGGPVIQLSVSDGQRDVRIPSQPVLEQREARDRLAAAIQQSVPAHVHEALAAWSADRGDPD